ncbi:MAG TPA: hypothetical protein VIL20_18755 [Sandaracinaceae bacterium]
MHTVVVFPHDARDRVDAALRELEESGVDRRSVLVKPFGELPAEQGPRSVLGLPHRVHYAGVGAALGMLVGLASRTEGSDIPATIWLVIVGAALGGFFGALVGSLVGGIRRQRWRMRAPHAAVAVRVEAESPELIARAREVLLAHGGEPRAPA